MKLRVPYSLLCIVALVAVTGARAVAAVPGAPAAVAVPTPVLLCPADGMEMTDCASYFRWSPIKDCTHYDIQIARDSGFQQMYRTTRTENVRYHEDCYFPREILPAGRYWWRVRAWSGGDSSGWSQAFRVSVDTDHPIAQNIVRIISPEKPIFLMRNFGLDPRAHASRIQEIIPPAVTGIIVPDDTHIWNGDAEAIDRARAYDAAGIDFVVWNNRARAPLSLLEYLFQHFKHCIGTAEGEHFWSWGWEKGPEGNISEWDYVNRAWILCGKYGRLYFIGDGEYTNYKWTIISHDLQGPITRYHHNIVPMFKSTIGMVGLHSLGATEGLMAAGWVDNCGYWADEFVWNEAGFGKMGEIDSTKKFAQGTELCPFSFDVQMWLMGIASGSTAFHLESAHQWTGEGTGAPNYGRFFLPFVTAVVEHHLIPARRAFLNSLRIAVACDYETAQKPHHNRYEPDFAFLTTLYALKHTPFQEIIPDNSRYGILCLLPPGATCLNPAARIIPQADLLPPDKATAVFNRAYPARFGGDAFQWECDGTVIITNSNENQDIPQTFDIKLNTLRLSGSIGVHQYLIGKVEKGGLWFQTNGEYPDRAFTVRIQSPVKPHITVTPERARVTARWDPAGKITTLILSVKDGPAECTLHP